MDYSTVMSDFQLQGTRILNLDVKNDFINIFDSAALATNVSIGNVEPEIKTNGDKLESVFVLQISVTAKDLGSSRTITINLSIEGLFTSKNNDKDLFRQMLLLNGNTALYSIARAHIITISSLVCNRGDIVLPMINFVEMLKAKQNQEQE